MSGVRQTQRSADAAKRSPVPPARRAPVARRPAYLQSKMAVSRPGDTQEREADQVAAQVARSPRADKLQRAGLAPGPEREEQTLAPAPVAAARSIHRQAGAEENPLQTRLQRQEEEEAVQTRLMRQAMEEEEPVQARLARQAADAEEPIQARLLRQAAEEEEPLQTRLRRQAAGEEEEPIQARKAGPVAGQTLDPETEQRIESQRGTGQPLAEDVRADMEARFGEDFSAVQIHTDAEAGDLAAKLGARAFTVGRDVFFAPGEYAPETDAGRELLAHELTHVVQQGDGAGRWVMRSNGEGEPPATGSNYDISVSPPELRVGDLPVPDAKANPSTSLGRFYRSVAYNRSGDPSQAPLPQYKWLESTSAEGGSTVLGEFGFQDGRPYNLRSRAGNGTSILGDKARLAQSLRIPLWDGNADAASFDVDHMVELQTAGWPDDAARPANSISNLRLLGSSVNQEFGRSIATSINERLFQSVSGDDTLQQVLQHEQVAVPRNATDRETGAVKRHFNIVFSALAPSGEGPAPAAEQLWQASDIDAGNHFRQMLSARVNNASAKSQSSIRIYDFGPDEDASPATPFNSRVEDGIQPESLLGSSERIVLHVGELGGKKEAIAWEKIEAGEVRHIQGIILDSLFAGKFNIQTFTFNRDSDEPGEIVGSLAQYGRTPVQLPSSIHWPIGRVPGTRFAGYLDYRVLLDEFRRLNPTFPGLSPIEFDQIGEGANGIHIEGRILPTVPLIADAQLQFSIDGDDLRVFRAFRTGDVNVPAPFEISDSSLVLSVGSESGFGIEGRVDFAIQSLGEGHLGASASTASGFALEGAFDFDTQLFDPARVEMSYRDEQLSVSGEIGIPRGKVPGIASATITANYTEGEGFTATGEATLDIPGVEQGTLTVSQSEEEGFSIGGTFQLSGDIPGIRGGSIEATLRERPDGEGYSVSASGEAQPDIPGFDSTLAIRYQDGAITLEATAAYQRGLLSGQVRFGATNRTLDAEGNPTGEPGDSLIAYGGGEVTLQIAPWLQGTAGIEFAPDGEVTVAGEIGLPDQIEIFPRKEIRKDILSIDIPIPIVPGIFAEVGGGLDAHAGIGPGVIDQLRLGVEYTPSREEDTRVTGDAHLNVPADAGLRLSVRAGIGLGIPAASVSGGLEIGGELGLEGAAEAGVQIDWMPSTGLEIDAFGRLSAQPKFTFDISGYVEVEALFFTIYEERWELASYELGSNLTFGVRFPIHYKEGEPFDISLDDVEFEVPDVNPRQILGDLMDAIA